MYMPLFKGLFLLCLGLQSIDAVYLFIVCPQMSGRSGKEPKESSGRRGRRSNGDGQGGKARRKRNDAAKVNYNYSYPSLDQKNDR